MVNKHTPGPWTLEDHGYKFIVSKPGDGYITREVCRMDGSTMAAFHQKGNARLIAAAPDLLEVLKDYHAFAASDALYARRVLAAIAKATGEQT